MVLVTGTVVYGKGDDQELAEQIAEGMYDDMEEQPAAAVPPVGEFAWSLFGTGMESKLGHSLVMWAARRVPPPWHQLGLLCPLIHHAASSSAMAVPVAGAGSPLAASSMPIAMGASVGSLNKSTMNIGAFSGSLSRSLMRNRLPNTPPPRLWAS